MSARLAMDIYFSLTRTQQRKFHSLGYSALFVHHVDMNDFKKITKNKKLWEMMIELKRMYIRRVA